MKQVRNFLSRDKLKEELESLSKKPEKSISEIELSAQTEFYNGNYQEAISILEEALELESENKYLLYKRCQCNNRLDNLNEALDDLEQCLIIGPEFELARNAKVVIEERIAQNRKYWAYVYG